MRTLPRALAISAFLAVVTAASSCSNAPPPPVPGPFPANNPPAVDALIKRVTTRYGNAKSYRDKGTGTTTLASLGTTKLDFDTAFARDGGFRWRYTNDLLPGGSVRRTSAVWSPNGEAWSFWTELTGKTTQFDSLGMALAGPTGVSNGLARIVPELLLPNQGRSTLFIGLTNPVVRGKETLSGVECDVIDGGILGADGATTIWIDATGAIRKYRQTMKVDPSKLPPPPSQGSPGGMPTKPFEVVSEFVFDPQFDVEVSASDTAFTPPS